jgi:hypothetical protein
VNGPRYTSPAPEASNAETFVPSERYVYFACKVFPDEIVSGRSKALYVMDNPASASVVILAKESWAKETATRLTGWLVMHLSKD